jgi:hypothetical protein
MTYTDEQLINRVKAIDGRVVPDKYLIIGLQSKADNFNVFDDKFYVFLGGKFIMVTTGTTNAGSSALLHFENINKEGAAVWKTNEFYTDLYGYGLHHGKMACLRQQKPIKYYRDTNRNEKAEEIGELHEGIINANFHGVSYDPESKIIKTNINGWSAGCQVCNNMSDYRAIIRMVRAHPLKADYALIKEF